MSIQINVCSDDKSSERSVVNKNILIDRKKNQFYRIDIKNNPLNRTVDNRPIKPKINNNINSPSEFKDIKIPIYNKKKLLSSNNNNINSSKKEKSSFNQIHNNKNNINLSSKNKKINKICLICEDELTDIEMKSNLVKCFHLFCDYCYYNYFKEKINNNDVENIKCPEINCNQIIFNDFIEMKLIKDLPLLEKYKKFKVRKQLLKNPNVKLCPYPDCESYARKKKDKYVQCIQNKHEFCFDCLKKWHGYKPCKIERDKRFENYINAYKVKRCPRCKYYIEKNEGCNHITCFNCKYQWCWLCMEEYKYDHYDFGSKCFGLQYSKCICFSNKFCLCLIQILIYLAKILLFCIAASFALILGIHGRIWDNIVNFYDHGFARIISYISIGLISLSFSGILISISSLTAVIITIIWPLQNIVFNKISDLY